LDKKGNQCDKKIYEGRREIAGKRLFCRAGRDIRVPHEFWQLYDRDKSGRLNQDHPYIPKTWKGKAPHLRKEDAPEYKNSIHPARVGGFYLTPRYREIGSTENFRRESPIDKPNGHDTRQKRIKVNINFFIKHPRQILDDSWRAIVD
jgi:hypothetical protein